MADATAEGNPATDPRAWVDRHGDYLYRFALTRVGRADAAEDLVQDALLAAWKGRAGFAGQSAERTWLTGILKRKVADWLRARVRDRLRTADAGPDAFADRLFTRRGLWAAVPGRWSRPDPAGPAERAEFWAALHGCLDKLPPRARDAFALRYLDDAAGEDVCRELGVSPANLWVTLHRARVRVWACLSTNWFGEESSGRPGP